MPRGGAGTRHKSYTKKYSGLDGTGPGNIGEELGKDGVGFDGAGGDWSGRIDPELHTKMSKKIAQLTKVVYHLNTKNDEAEQRLKYMEDTTQQRVQEIEQETLETVARYRDEIRRLQDTEASSQVIVELKTEFESQKAAAITEVEKVKSEALRREQVLRREHAIALQKMGDNMLSMHGEFQQRLAAFEELTSVIQNKMASEAKRRQDENMSGMCEMKERHDKDMAALKEAHREHTEELEASLKEANAKRIAEITKEKLDEIETLSNSVDRVKISAVRETEESFERDFEVMRDQHELDIKILEEQARERIAEVIEEMEENGRNQCHNLRDEIDTLKSELCTAVEELDNTVNVKASLEQKVERMSVVGDQLELKVENANKKVNMLNDLLNDTRRELDEQNAECLSRGASLREKALMITELENTMAAKQKSTEELVQRVGQLKGDLDEVQRQKNLLESQHKKVCGEHASSLKETIDLKERLSAIDGRLKAEHEAMFMAAQVDASSATASVKETMELQLARERQESDARIEAMQEKSEQALADQNLDWEMRLEAEVVGTTSKFTRMLEVANGEVENLRTRIAELEKISVKGNLDAALVKELEASKQTLEEKLSHMEATTRRLQEALEESKESVSRERTIVKEFREKEERLRNELRQRGEVQVHVEQMAEDMKTEWATKVEEAEARTRNEMKDINQQEKANLVMSMNRIHTKATDELEGAHQKKLREQEEINTTLKAQVSEVKAQRERDAEVFANNGKTRQVAYDTRIEEVEQMHRLTIKAFHSTHQTDLSVLEEKLKGKFDAQRQELHESGEKRTQDLVDVHVEEVALLKSHHTEALHTLQSSMSTAHSQDLENVRRAHTEEFQTQTKALSEQMQKLRQDLTATHKTKVSQLSQQITTLEKKMGDLRSEHEMLSQAYTETSSALEEATCDAAAKTSRIGEMERLMESRLRDVTVEIRKEHERVTAELEAGHLVASEKMMVDFMTAERHLKDKVAELTTSLHELRELHAQRPPRDEDLVLIGELEEQCGEYNKTIIRLVDDNNHYKLELVNREKTYNQLFSTKAPNIGSSSTLHTAGAMRVKPPVGRGGVSGAPGGVQPTSLASQRATTAVNIINKLSKHRSKLPPLQAEEQQTVPNIRKPHLPSTTSIGMTQKG